MRADYVKKYQPQKIPAWLFPIIFEEGGGQRDTIYLGYDEDASNQFGGADTMFGEYKEPLDSLFHAYWGSLITNKVIKNTVKETLYSGISITFHKGHMPVWMYWDPQAFYSDSLPFPDNDPLPRAQGEMMCSYGNPFYYNCPLDFPIILSDTIRGIPGTHPWLNSDSSKKFWGDPQDLASGLGISLSIVKWGPWVGIPRNSPDDNLLVNPTAFTDHITIAKNAPGVLTCQLFALDGRLVRQSKITAVGKTRIHTHDLPQGFYFLKAHLENNNEILLYKLMKY